MLLGAIRTLSKIDRALLNFPEESARLLLLLLCFENLGKRSIPIDHAAVRVDIQKPTTEGHQGNRLPSWMSKNPVFCSILKRLGEEHQFPTDPFGALADFKIIIEKIKKADCSRTLTQDT